MGIFSFFRRKKEPLQLPPELPKFEAPKPVSLEASAIENVKAKMDLLLTQLDSLKTQHETLNERIRNIEQILQEIRSYYYQK
ncbi:MAG: hypothetical protein QMD12_02205 [Candidatus Aenigmarchaeota archaeon]|nr:hypothetical protein [Candidatus Aenigmarchaeota archaeon]